jgi:hypothetical protein
MSWCVEGSRCEYRPLQGKGWLATLYRRAVVNLAGSRRRFYSSHWYLWERHLSLLSSSLTPLGLVALHRLYSASHCAFDFARIMIGWDEERGSRPNLFCTVHSSASECVAGADEELQDTPERPSASKAAIVDLTSADFPPWIISVRGIATRSLSHTSIPKVKQCGDQKH